MSELWIDERSRIVQRGPTFYVTLDDARYEWHRDELHLLYTNADKIQHFNERTLKNMNEKWIEESGDFARGADNARKLAMLSVSIREASYHYDIATSVKQLIAICATNGELATMDSFHSWH